RPKRLLRGAARPARVGPDARDGGRPHEGLRPGAAALREPAPAGDPGNGHVLANAGNVGLVPGGRDALVMRRGLDDPSHGPEKGSVMFRIPLPLNDSTLLVVPRWGELGTVMQVMLLTLMAAL